VSDTQHDLPDDPALRALYQSTRRETPPPALDLAILTEARRAARRSQRRRLVPLASAALVLLGLSFSLRLLWFEHPASQPSPAGRLQERDQEQARPPAAPAPPPVPAAVARPAPPAKATAPAPPPPAPTDMRAGATAPASIQAETEGAVAAPDPWLTQILTLLHQGDRDAARQELEAFRRRYPGHPLPEELQLLLAP
jgi:hypothetical protein